MTMKFDVTALLETNCSHATLQTMRERYVIFRKAAAYVRITGLV